VGDQPGAPPRPALDPGRLRDLVVRPGGLWRDVTVVAATGSTNQDLRAAAMAGAREGMVLAAEEQVSGRGRVGRSWQAPPRSSLAVSVLLRPPVRANGWGWLPLVVGTAVAEAVTQLTGLSAQVKWPNDILLPGGKVAGVLAERVPTPSGPAVVAGIGLNVSQTVDELPETGADGPLPTSLLVAGSPGVDRTLLTSVVLDHLADGYRRWLTDPEQTRLRCLEWSGTLGRRVRAMLPGGAVHEGLATDLDQEGRLVVATEAGTVVVGAGDIAHLRHALDR
jgi:BirA family biotin operon repressor/biotin-[acetyl-CoA-carboxylase] ligase